MLKSQGIEAIPNSVPPFQVSVCARRRPLLNTLRVNTQTGGPPVPCANALPGPAGETVQRPALQQKTAHTPQLLGGVSSP